MSMAQMKAYDQLFFDTGAEEEDINRAIQEHSLAETEEYKSMISGTKAKLEEKFNEIKRQAIAKRDSKNAAAAAEQAQEPSNDTNDLSAPAPGLQQEQPDEFDAAQMEF